MSEDILYKMTADLNTKANKTRRRRNSTDYQSLNNCLCSPHERLNYVAKSYSSSAIMKHLKAGTECTCLAVFETCPFGNR